MDWAYYLILLVMLAAGLFINILGLPGLWLMVGSTAVYAYVTRFPGYIGTTMLIVLVVLAALAEVVEFVAGSAGAKKAGATKKGMFGAVVGALIGGIFLSVVPIPVISTIIGACLGAFIGAAGMELIFDTDVERAARIGFGAAKGRLAGIVLKSLFGVIIFLCAAIDGLPL
jgi:uncharacterized protein YqgC (DUF456 family)